MSTDTRSVVEKDDRYILPLVDRTVSRCYVDFAFGMFFYEDGPETELRIEGKMRLLSKGQEIMSDPTDLSSLGPLLNLFGKSVVWAHVFKNGTLKILFEGEVTLEVGPDENYETWQLASKDGLMFVSVPGGSVAYWKALASKAN